MALRMTETALLDAVFHSRVSAEEIHRWLDRVASLLERQQAFFFISSTAPQTTFCENYRQIQGIWYKQHKAAFRTCCLGLVRIVDTAAEQARLDTPALHAAWAVPYFVTLDRAEGYRWIAAQRVQHEPLN